MVTLNSGLSLNRFVLILYFSATVIISAPISWALNTSSDKLTKDEVITEVKVEGLHSIKNEELLYLLGIEAGKGITPELITIGIKRAFLKGIFDNISVFHKGKGRLRIVVKERDVIEGITIAGIRHFSKREIKSFIYDLPFREGQIMRYDLLKGLRDHVTRSLAERGFPGSRIDIDVIRTSKPYRVNLLVNIEEGEPIRIKRLIIIGDGSVRKLLGLDDGDIYDNKELLKGIERIKKYYKKEGRVNFVIGPHTFSKGELSIQINPGKKLNISFTGNEFISSKNLFKELPFTELENFRDDMIEEAVSNMKSLYHRMGFINPQIAPVLSEDAQNIYLNFFIFEGKRVRIRSISFTGNSIAEKSLKDIMISTEGEYLNPEDLSLDRERISEFYNALGYLSAEVDEPLTKINDLQADIFINIKEGPRTIIDNITIEGNRIIDDESIMAVTGLKKGNPYNEVDISDARYRVLDLYAAQGLIDADLTLRREFVENRARITIVISEGKQIQFGKTIIRGNKKTNNTVIERELLHREGEPLNYSLLTRVRQRLYRLGLFTEVNLEPLERYDSKQDIMVTLKEGNAGAIEFGFGYGDYEKYRGFIDVSYRNLFGMNRQGALRLELTSLEKRFILNYYEPWFLSASLPLMVIALREDRKEKNIDTGEISYRLTRHTLTGGIERNLTDFLKAELYYEFSVVRTFDVKPDVILSREDTGTLAISAIRPALIYDTRDNPFDPASGILAGLTIKAASGLLLSETDFVKVMMNASMYRRISKRSILALSIRTGIAQGFGSTRELPLVERFFAGGRNTVRGYEQDMLGPKGADGTPTGGNAFIVTDLELRNYLGKGLSFVTFIDGGNVWHKISDMNLSLKYTAGVGLRYNTPVGPLRIDYGHKLMKERGESSGEVHFSIGHAF